MSSFLFSADSSKKHPWFAGDGFEIFRDQVIPMLEALEPRQPWFSEELLELLKESASTSRENLPQHVTTSSVVLSPQADSVLLLFHNKIGEWVYPGGHADGDWHLLRSSLRECFEETSLGAVEVLPPRCLNRFPNAALCPHLFQKFSIQQTRTDPAHVHFDAVFVLRAVSSGRESFDPRESSALKWIPIGELQHHANRGAGIVDGIDALTAQICLGAMQSALGSGDSEGTLKSDSKINMS